MLYRFAEFTCQCAWLVPTTVANEEGGQYPQDISLWVFNKFRRQANDFAAIVSPATVLLTHEHKIISHGARADRGGNGLNHVNYTRW